MKNKKKNIIRIGIAKINIESLLENFESNDLEELSRAVGYFKIELNGVLKMDKIEEIIKILI